MLPRDNVAVGTLKPLSTTKLEVLHQLETETTLTSIVPRHSRQLWINVSKYMQYFTFLHLVHPAEVSGTWISSCTLKWLTTHAFAPWSASPTAWFQGGTTQWGQYSEKKASVQTSQALFSLLNISGLGSCPCKLLQCHWLKLAYGELPKIEIYGTSG